MIDAEIDLGIVQDCITRILEIFVSYLYCGRKQRPLTLYLAPQQA